MNRTPRCRLVAGLLVGLAACGGGGSGTVDGGADAVGIDARPPADADPFAVPRVEPAACRYQVDSSLGFTEGVDYDCGDLIVDENRAVPDRHIRLHYIRFASGAGTGNAAIYLDGGPGGNGQNIVGYLGYLGNSFVDGMLADGDFLVLSQRGTSLSVPFLDCAQNDCSDFADVADLPTYNTGYNADDVDDLRVALGYDQLDVWGISYGSRLGLEVLRRHGDHVRAAMLGGLVPAQINWPAAVPASFYSSITALDASCADAGACGTAFGNLVDDFTTGVDALNAAPVQITSQSNDFWLDGYTYAYLLFQVLYSRSTYPWLPMIVSDLAERRTDRVNDVLAQFLQWAGGGDGISVGLYYSVVCGELFNPPDETAFDTANAAVPSKIRDIYGGSWYGLLDTCSTWPVGNFQTALAAPVESAVPTLVSNGRLDPITPPGNGAIAAATLSNSVDVVYENSGHGATLQSGCGNQLLLGFLANPSPDIDTSCAATVTTDYVLPSAAAARPLPAARIRAELAVAPISPEVQRRFRQLQRH